MSAPVLTQSDAASDAAPGRAVGDVSAAGPTRPRRRWPRLVIPFGVIAVFWALAFLAHGHQEPNLGDENTFSPTGTGRHGSSQLADALREQGVAIDRVTSTDEAIAAARETDATIFVPAPDLLDGRLVSAVAATDGLHRIVLVEPGFLARAFSGVPAFVAHRRWAAQTVPPRCTTAYANEAGPATVYRDRYTAAEGVTPTTLCYGGSIIGFRQGNMEILYVGASEPFRNDRFGEAGNAALATSLLGHYGRVVWVDVHRTELRVALPGLELPEYQRGDQDRTNTGDPLLDSFPVQLWAALVLLVGAAVLLALARARRLGPPVPEPLPVVVPAAETVTGRGRLYRRINAREASLATLRAAALAQLARIVTPSHAQVRGGEAGDPFARNLERSLLAPGAQRDAFVRAVAARAGIPEAAVVTVLFGPPPTDDAQLVTAAAELDRLVAIVAPAARTTQTQPPTTAPPPAEQPGGSS